jgi:hypothetical protein
LIVMKIFKKINTGILPRNFWRVYSGERIFLHFADVEPFLALDIIENCARYFKDIRF